MPQAVTHIFIVIILLDLYRDYFVKDKRNFPLHYILIGGIAGLLPDIDVIIYYILSFFGYGFGQIHRTFTHTLFFPLFFIVLAIPFLNFKNRKLSERHLKLRNIFLVIAFGCFVHLILDALVAGVIMPFYPISSAGLGLNLINLFPLAWQGTIEPVLDGVILVLWLISLEYRKRLQSLG